MYPLHLMEEMAVVGAAAASAATLAHAALRPESQIFGHTLIAGKDPNEVALTYDDGPNDVATEALLKLLDRHHAKATFFMIGRFVRERPHLVREVRAAGHLIGNHTFTHPWLAWKSAGFIREELRRCNEALEDVLGEPVRYFRPPHGARRPAVLRAAHELGLTVVQWNVMGYDWEPIGAERIWQHLQSGLRRSRRRGVGSNVLLHDGFDITLGADRSGTVLATERLLEQISARGGRTVTVDAWQV